MGPLIAVPGKDMSLKEILLLNKALTRSSAYKQMEMEHKINSLCANYSTPLSLAEERVLGLSISELVTGCRSGALQPASILEPYLKKALLCHQATNCLSDLMFENALDDPLFADCTPRYKGGAANQPGLLGIPVSIKDTIDIVGHDSTIGFSRNVRQPAKSSSAMVKLLQDAGAILHVKTTVPTGLISLETSSDMFGRTSNPHNGKHSAGASTGGGAALVAGGGSKIEIGTDIAGSVRIPAHFCGIWSIKGSSGRFPSWGNRSPMPGLHSIPLVVSPLASNLDDLQEFCKQVIHAKPWVYDHTCIPLPWRSLDLHEDGRKLKWGVIWDDGVLRDKSPDSRYLLTFKGLQRYYPSDARLRARFTSGSRRSQAAGTRIAYWMTSHSFPSCPPDISEGLNIGYQLLFSDGGEGSNPKCSSTRRGGHSSCKRGIRPIKPSTARQEIVISVVLHLDYAAGVMPVTYVNKTLDGLPKDFAHSEEYQRLSSVGKGAYLAYDADKMHGLPVGIQVAGLRLEEEKVLGGMRVIETALRDLGIVFVNKVTL
ncbi:hypothetical protein CVT26_004252 [Gymnopilus dilepis]|uniref:Amidase domain-containing protein n=1 Tax=Gymnopilus dilepis TaxID=231916 RepID=A0A409YVE1_9AGAR|nr:hypothetical protein CVT26_004252 [Gymnopilus dilepis]